MPLEQIDLRSYWRQVAWLPQRPAVTPQSVFENVVRGRSIDRSAVLAAAVATGLSQVVASLPDGWNTRLGQGGFGLSVGQRQRLALTRVLAGDEPLVLLDEPTAHLDAQGDAVVLAALSTLRARGRSVVVVTHRKSLAAMADRIVQVDASDRRLPQTPLEEKAA